MDVAINEAMRHLGPMFGNWPTAHQNIVAENAHGVDEPVECGPAKTTDASAISRVKSSVLLLPRVVRTYRGIHASAMLG